MIVRGSLWQKVRAFPSFRGAGNEPRQYVTEEFEALIASGGNTAPSVKYAGSRQVPGYDVPGSNATSRPNKLQVMRQEQQVYAYR
jgi:hypothetical protein